METREAMDYLAKTKGIQDFVLMGLCSGADMAHNTAVVDKRVRGLMLLDAWAYRTPAYYWHRFWQHYAPRLLKWKVWKNALRVRWQMLLGTRPGRLVPSEGVELAIATYERVFPPRQRVERDLVTFVERNIALYCLWTGGLIEYNHRGQYASAFRSVKFNGLLREEHLADSDHIVTGLDHQSYLLKNVVRWANTL